MYATSTLSNMDVYLIVILLGSITPGLATGSIEFRTSYNLLRRMNPSNSINDTDQLLTPSPSSHLSMTEDTEEEENKIKIIGNLNQIHRSRQVSTGPQQSKYPRKFPVRGQRIQKLWRPVNLTENFRPGEAEVCYEFKPSLNSLKNITRGELSIPTIALYNPKNSRNNEIHIYGTINFQLEENNNLTPFDPSTNKLLLGTLLVNNETRQDFVVTEFLQEIVTSALTTTEMTRVSIVFTVSSPCNHLKPQQCSSFVHDINNPRSLPILKVNYYQPSTKPV